MLLYNLYIYNRKGKCLYYREWNRPLNTLSDDPDEEKRLMSVNDYVFLRILSSQFFLL